MNNLKTQLPEGHGRGGGHVEGVHVVGRGDAHGLVAPVDGGPGQPVSLRAQQQGQLVGLVQTGVLNGVGVGGEGQGDRAKAQGVELL